MTYLLDSDVTLARATPDHPHYEAAGAWLRRHPRFAVCPITEGALVRASFGAPGGGHRLADYALRTLASLPGYEFWPDDLSYGSVDLSRLTGHKQITDAYLVALAATHGGRPFTFDRALVAVHPKAILVPTA